MMKSKYAKDYKNITAIVINLFLDTTIYFSQAETTGLKNGKLVSSGCAG